MCLCLVFLFSSRRRHTRCALVTGVQTCALPISPADVLITASRAATLKLVNQRAAASGPVRIGRVPWLDLAAAVGLADPVFDLTRPLKGPFAARDVGAADAADAEIQLDKLAGLDRKSVVSGKSV